LKTVAEIQQPVARKNRNRNKKTEATSIYSSWFVNLRPGAWNLRPGTVVISCSEGKYKKQIIENRFFVVLNRRPGT
jgi:hypothetical protein